MFRSGTRLLAHIALASCVGVASWGCCSAEKAAGVVFVAVSSKAMGQLGSKPATPAISCKKKQQLIWMATPGEKLTQITIHLGGNPSPFKNCNSSGDPCVIQCQYGVCVSGAINLEKCPDKDLYYTYDTAFVASGQADPGLIIRP